MSSKDSPRPEECVAGKANCLTWRKRKVGENKIVDKFIRIIAQFFDQSPEIIAVEFKQTFKEDLLKKPIPPAHIRWYRAHELPFPQGIFSNAVLDCLRQLSIDKKHSRKAGCACRWVRLARLAEEKNPV